jgi:hypothetical protein
VPGSAAVRDNVGNIQPETDNLNILIGMTKKLNQDWELAFKGSLFQRDSHNNRGVALSTPAQLRRLQHAEQWRDPAGIGAVRIDHLRTGRAGRRQNLTNTLRHRCPPVRLHPGRRRLSVRSDNTANTTRFGST